MTNTQKRFEEIFYERLEQFEKKKPGERGEEAKRIINVFRALFAVPLDASFMPRDLYGIAMTKITETESLTWPETDSKSVPLECSADVLEIQNKLFEAVDVEYPKKITQFGTLSVEGLQRDYLGG